MKMKTLIIGGTGHTGVFLVKQLVDEGHDVVVASSGRTTVSASTIYEHVKLEKLSYDEMIQNGSFQALLAQCKPDAVIDLLQRQSTGVYSACKNAGVSHLIFCGSLWMYGRPKIVPTPEVRQTKCSFEAYDIRYNQLLEVIEASKEADLAVSAIMPSNICGPGKVPLEGMGGRSIDVHRKHRQGDEVCLPFPGTNLIGPCDVEDVANGFVCALHNRENAAGNIYNVGSSYALTSQQFINTYADIYGTSIPIRYVDPKDYITNISPDIGSYYHFLEHMCPDIAKISAHLGYKPKYTPEASMERAVKWMLDSQLL